MVRFSFTVRPVICWIAFWDWFGVLHGLGHMLAKAEACLPPTTTVK